MKKCSARDVIYLLRMLVQECDDMSNFSEVPASLKQDVHVCLKKFHETYSAACCISVNEMLADRSSSSVVRNSISTMLVPRVPKSTRYFMHILFSQPCTFCICSSSGVMTLVLIVDIILLVYVF